MAEEAQAESRECPFCVMMRRGGCEVPFQAFMDCGERADKAKQEMTECLPMYEALHACMEKNKEVFDALLAEMKAEDAARDAAAAEVAAVGAEASGSGIPVGSGDDAAVPAPAAATEGEQQQQDQQ